MKPVHAVPSRNVTGALLVGVALVATAARYATLPEPATVSAKLSQWKVELSEATSAPGPVTFTISNAGSIPHAFEVEGQGIEEETKLIQPGTTATLTLTLKPGTYEVYCPVGDDSHKKLGMVTRLAVGSKGAKAPAYGNPATLPSCSTEPSFMMAILSAIAIASTWSCVT